MVQTGEMARPVVLHQLQAVERQLEELYREEIARARQHRGDLARARRLYDLRCRYQQALGRGTGEVLPTLAAVA